MSLFAGIVAADGALVADVPVVATVLQWRLGPHGAASAEVELDGVAAVAVLAALQQGLLWLTVNDNGVRIWQGRIEEPRIRGDTLALTAFGAWAALSDLPYTAFWSSTRISDWEGYSGAGPAALFFGTTYQGPASVFDTAALTYADGGTELRIQLRDGAGYWSGDYTGFAWAKVPRSPDAGTRGVKQLSFELATVRNDPNIQLRMELFALNAAGTVVGASPRYTITTNTPGTTDDPIVLDIAESTVAMLVWRISVSMPQTRMTYTRVANDLIRLINLRVTSTTTGTVSPSFIINDIAEEIAATNPGQLAPYAAEHIPVSDHDIADLVYEDANMATVLDELAQLGAPGGDTPWRVAVALDGTVVYGPPPAVGEIDNITGRHVQTLVLHEPPTEIGYPLRSLVNEAYVRYTDMQGRPAVTPYATDAASQARYGITRRQAVRASTYGIVFDLAALAIAQGATVAPVPDVVITQLFDAYGRLVPLWLVAPGDVLELPAPVLGVLDGDGQLLRIRITDVAYDAIADRLTVTLEGALPRLDVLLAQAMVRAQRG